MPSWPESAADRVARLVAAGHNVARLPSAAVTRELATDAGHAHRRNHARADVVDISDVGALWRSLFRVEQVLTTTSGRDAEAILASALVSPGRRVLANEAYVSSRWWIERFGGTVDEFGTEPLGEPSGAGSERVLDDVSYVLLTLPPAQLGPRAGRPVSLNRVTRVRRWIDRWCPDVPLVIDASRLWENAAGVEVEPAAFLALCDIVILSAGKDIGAPSGGLVGGRSELWWPRLVDAARVWHGQRPALTLNELANIADGLSAVRAGGARDRHHEMTALADDLLALGLPPTWAGCGSIYLDAGAWLPNVPRRELPAQTLLNVIYLVTGWRGLGTASDDAGPLGHGGPTPTVRLAVRDAAAALRHELPRVAEVAAELRSGLCSVPRDRAAPYLQSAVPVDESVWPTEPAASASSPPVESTTAPGWLIARPPSGCGPQRALAEALTRWKPGAVLRTADPILRDLHERFSRVASTAPRRDPVVADAVRLPDRITGDERSAALLLVDIGSADRWPAIADLEGGDAVDVYWAAPADGEDRHRRGIVAVRVGSPIAPALDAGSLFTLSAWFTPFRRER